MEQLGRLRITNASRAVEVLCEIVRKLGTVQPETTIVTKYLAKAAHSGGPALERLRKLIDERHTGAIQCGYLVLASLGERAQVLLGQSLSKEILRRDTSDSLTEGLVRALKELKNLDARRAVTEELSKSLDSPDGLRTRNAVAILSHVGDRSLESALLKVLRRLLDGYYGGHTDAIGKDLCSYFTRFQTKAAVRGLLRGVERRWQRCFAEAVAAICDRYPETQANLLRLARNTSDVSVKVECLYALATIQKTKPSVREIAGIVEEGDLLKYDSVRVDFKKVLLRNPRESRPIPLEMVRSDDERRYEFALEVLKEMHVPIEEISRVLGFNPVVAMYKYFFGGPADSLGLEALWGTREKLGDGVRGTTTKFEHLLRHLLSCLGFITLDVSASRRPGVDTVAFSPTWSHVLLLGSTTGVVGDNLGKLANTVTEVRAALGELARKIEILPIVATSMAAEINPKDQEYAKRNGIVVLQEMDVDRLLGWVNTNRSYKKLLLYLEVKAERSRSRTLWEALQRSTRRV